MSEVRSPSDTFIRSGALSGFAGLLHGFTRGRLSDGTPLSLTLDTPPQRWAWLCEQLGAPTMPVSLVRQVHGARVIVAEGPGLLGEADALITRQRGLLLAIRVADCVPVLVLGEDGEVAAIHAGWRGVAAGVVPAALSAMAAPKIAVVGPCISAPNYEVGEEVIRRIVAGGVPESVVADRRQGPRAHADLKAAVRWQLSQFALQTIDVLPHCSLADPALHSFRRDGAASGRMAALIGWLP